MRRVIETLSAFAGLLSGVLLSYLILGIGVDVFLRSTVGYGMPAVVEYGDVALVGLVYFALAQTQRDGGHVVSGYVASLLPVKLRVTIELIGWLTVIPVLAVVTWHAAGIALESFQRGEYRLGLYGVLIWPARWAIVIGLIAWQLQLLLRVVDLLQAFFLGTQIDDESDEIDPDLMV